jgi:hypothetical protein
MREKKWDRLLYFGFAGPAAGSQRGRASASGRRLPQAPGFMGESTNVSVGADQVGKFFISWVID